MRLNQLNSATIARNLVLVFCFLLKAPLVFSVKGLPFENTFTLDGIIDYFGTLLWFFSGAILAIGEIILPGIFLIWFALSAVTVGFLDLFFQLDLVTELILLAVISFLFVALGYRLRRLKADEPDPVLSDRTLHYIGKSFEVVEPIKNGAGKIKIGDTRWIAHGEDCETGTSVIVTAAKGPVLEVKIV